MEAFLDYIIKGLVDRPDAVSITPSDKNGVTVYELRVHPTDMGKIIGRQGATINAIRALLLVGSAKRGLRCSLEVVDEENPNGTRQERPPRQERRDFGQGRRPGGRSGPPRGGAGRNRPQRQDSTPQRPVEEGLERGEVSDDRDLL